MSIVIEVYTKSLGDDLIPKIIKRLNEFDMIVELNPNFSFQDDSALGFKYQFKNPKFELFKNKKLTTSLVFGINNFDLLKAKKDLQPKLSFFDKLFGRKKEIIEYASAKIENELRHMTTVSTFSFGGNVSEFRFSLLTSTILAELTSGFLNDTEEDKWHIGSKKLTDKYFKEIIEYEKSLNEDEFKFEEFKEW